MKKIGQLVYFLLLLGMCAFLVVVERGQSRLLAIVLLAVLALGGGTVIFMQLQQTANTGIMLVTLDREGSAFAIPPARGGKIFGLLFALAMTVASLSCLLMQPAYLSAGSHFSVLKLTLMGVGGTLVFGLLLIQAIAGLFNKHTGLFLLPQGIRSRAGFNTYFIPWDTVNEVGELEIEVQKGVKTPFLGIGVHDMARVTQSAMTRVARSDMTRMNQGATRRQYGYDCLISARVHTVPPATLQQVITCYRDHPERRPAIGTPEELARWQAAVATCETEDDDLVC